MRPGPCASSRPFPTALPSLFVSLLVSLLAMIALTGLAAPDAVRAEESAEALLQRIQERSARINPFRALLNDPDPATRLATLDVMLKSADVAMRELAFGVCFDSADQTMQVLCLKNKLAQMQTIAVHPKEQSERSPSELTALKDWGGVSNFSIDSFDEKDGPFTTAGSYRKGSGQATGIRVEFVQPYCRGSIELVEGARLDGELGSTPWPVSRRPSTIRESSPRKPR